MARRSSRPHENGFTLIEVLVAIILVGLLMGAVLIGFDVGIKAVGRGGAADRAAGAHDISSFEQQLSADVTRAGCVSVASTSYGACSRSIALGGSVIAQCSTAALCVAWSQSTGSNIGCHVDVYTQPGGANKKVVRTEYRASSGTLTSLAGVNVTTADGVKLSVSPTPMNPPPVSGGSWISLLSVTITASGVVNAPPSGTLQLRPLSNDPGGQAETVLC